MISGVCKGVAAFFNVDVTIVRLIFVLLAIVTGGAWILLYIAMMFVIPFANTVEEQSIAAGQPFNAQEVVDRAKRNYAEFKSGREWRRHWRQQRREWRRHWHENSYRWGHNMQRHAQDWASRTGYAGRVFAGVTIPLLAVVSAVLFITWLVALVSLATTGAIFGWTVVGSIPLWVAVLALIVVYNVIASPIRHARRAAYFATGGYNYPWFAAWDGVLWIGFLVLCGWLAYRYVPGAHEFLQHLPEHLQAMWTNIVDSFHHTKAHEPLQIEPTT
jgi:phage shock protein PspC (stress-responsive transcriptional regulator)